MRFGVFVALGLALGLACSLADELEGAACRGEADCDRSQTCSFTLHQQTTGIGTCSSKSGCVPGQQAGCTCQDRMCPAPELESALHPTERDANNAPLCFCCPTTDCELTQERVIVAIGSDGTARCRCCDSCPDSMQFRLDEEGNVNDDCECEDIPAETSTGTATASSTDG